MVEKKKSDPIEKILKVIIILMVSVMSTITFVQVIGRFVFNKGIVWAEELSVYSMFAMVYLASILHTKEESHVNITLWETVIKGSGRKLVEIVHYIIWMLYSILIVAVGFITSNSVAKQISPNMRISMRLVYMFIPISAFFMGIYTIKNVISKIRGND